MDDDDNLPEFAKMIDAMNEELSDVQEKYENKIKLLNDKLNSLQKKYEPDRSTVILIHNCIRNVNHNNLAKVIHNLNKDQFKCISLKKKEWLYKKDETFIPMENEIFVKKAIEDSLIVFQNEIRKIDDILENEPEHPLYDFYAFSSENFGKIFRSFDSPKITSFIMRELRELFYDPLYSQ